MSMSIEQKLNRQESLTPVVKELRDRLSDLTMQLTEISTEYTSFRVKSQTDIAELEDKLENEKQNSARGVQVEELQRQLKEERYALSTKEEQIEKLKVENAEKLKIVQDKLIQSESEIKVKDKFIEYLKDQNDEFKSNLERIGFETFLQLKNDLFAKEQEMDAQAIRRQYLPIYDELEEQVTAMMDKYKQQEEVNQDLMKQIEILEEQGDTALFAEEMKRIYSDRDSHRASNNLSHSDKMQKARSKLA